MSADVDSLQAAAPPVPPASDPWLEHLSRLFAYDVLHVRQKLRLFTQKYVIADEHDRPCFHVVRPPKLAINLVVGIAIGVVRLGVLLAVIQYIAGGGALAMALATLFVSNIVLGIVHALLAPYRDIEVHADEHESWRVLTITQDNKFGLWREYTLHDCLGGEVARFRRNTMGSFIRRDWHVEALDGTLLYRVREDSLVRALLRRYLGSLYGMLRTNFNFEFEDGTVFGLYDRKFTIVDQYLLDLRGDGARRADRRTTLAMAILLDTAESR